MAEEHEFRTVFVETASGERFEADIPCDTPLSKLAADFFNEQGWPTEQHGKRQRAVVELVLPDDPDDTKRLNGDDDICGAGIENGDVLRIFPESIAGAVDQRARKVALIADYNAMQRLTKRTPEITFETNRFQAPDQYTVTLNYVSFVEYLPGMAEPTRNTNHQVRITLGSNYPRVAPFVRWLTPIFHPNIRASDGAVCLGVLRERYLPGLGLANLVRQLANMVQWQNFDAYNSFNREAAEWAAHPANWRTIETIGGHPFQGPVETLFNKLTQAQQPRIQFRPVIRS